MSNPDDKKSLVVFQNNTIRRTWYHDEWYFAVVDVVAVLTDSINPTDYIKKIRRRDPILSQGWGQIVTPLPVETAGGMQKVNMVKRIIVDGDLRKGVGEPPINLG